MNDLICGKLKLSKNILGMYIFLLYLPVLQSPNIYFSAIFLPGILDANWPHQLDSLK